MILIPTPKYYVREAIDVTKRWITNVLSIQVATLQEYTPGRYQHKQFRNVHKLIQVVIKATENFINVAEQVAADNPDFQVSKWFHFTTISILIQS